MKYKVVDIDGDVLFIEATLEEVKSYFNLEEKNISDLYDMEEALHELYGAGEKIPTITEAEE